MKLTKNNPVLKEARTIHIKTIVNPLVKTILKPGDNNKKLGYMIKKGKWKGMPIFSLTLEERKTCPKSCLHWNDCYGNNMFLADRINHTNSFFIVDLWNAIWNLNVKYPKGFVVRLHVLGDFYSTEYVKIWRSMLYDFPELRVFGYTARFNCNIGKALDKNRRLFPDRWKIRKSSNIEGYTAVTEECNWVKAFSCPAQLKEGVTCSTCALCWTSEKSVRFKTH